MAARAWLPLSAVSGPRLLVRPALAGVPERSKGHLLGPARVPPSSDTSVSLQSDPAPAKLTQGPPSPFCHCPESLLLEPSIWKGREVSI